MRRPRPLLLVLAAALVAGLSLALTGLQEADLPPSQATREAVDEAVEDYRTAPGPGSGAALLDAAQQVDAERRHPGGLTPLGPPRTDPR